MQLFTDCQLPLWLIEHRAFRWNQEYLQPETIDWIPKSSNTLTKWLLNDFTEHTSIVKEYLAEAQSKIHISFDLWTSPNVHSVMAVCAHFIDHEAKNTTILLALRRMMFGHTGESIAEALAKVIDDFGIRTRIGFFMADNATENDKAIRVLLDQIRPDLGDPNQYRVRCLGHIINLASKAVIFGQDGATIDPVEDQVDEVVSENSTQKRRSRRRGQNLAQPLETPENIPMTKEFPTNPFWRDFKAAEKIHNIASFVRRTSNRREKFNRVTHGEFPDQTEGMFQQISLNVPVSQHRSQNLTMFSTISTKLLL